MSDNKAEIWLAQHPEIESIFACVCDLNGTMRGKRVPVDQLSKVIEGGLRMPLSIVGMDIWGEDVENSELVFETGDSDGLCDFTSRQLMPITWTSRPTALAMLWMRQEDGEPFPGDPRRALARVAEQYKERGLTPVVATELEFYLVDPSEDCPQAPRSPVTGKRLESDGAMSLDELQHFDEFLNDVYDACELQGIPADAAISENGINVFDNGGDEGTPLLLNAVAGLLATMQQNTLTFAPHENSYRRLLPGAHAPTSVSWGYENRTAAIRIPGGDPIARRIEQRVAGADANPYLVLTSILGGALLGIENEMQPAAPITGNAYSMNLDNLPLDRATAIDAFCKGADVPAIFSKRLQTMLVECKMQELRKFARYVTHFEYDSYLEVV